MQLPQINRERKDGAAVQLSKRMIGVLSVAFVWALSTPAAQANSWYGYAVREGSRQEGFQEQRPSRQNEERRPYYQRDERRDNQRSQRMSPDERRQLRRDIKDAGREIYPSRR